MIRAIFVYAIFCSGLLFGQDELVSKGRECAKSFSLEAEFGLPEYQMVAEITAETPPDAALLFKSKATMGIFHTEEYLVEKFSCYPKILSDDRPNGNNGKGGVMDYGPFGRIENWERMTLKDCTVDLINGQGKRIVPKWDAPVHPFTKSISTVCVKPFDWPIHGPSAFNGSMNEHDAYRFTFGADRKCISATNIDGLIETHWIKTSPQVLAVQKITFKDELPVCAETYLFGKPVDIKKYDLKEAFRLVRTETTWGKCGDTSVPRSIVSKTSGHSGLLLTTKVRLYSTDDEIFKKSKEQYSKLLEAADKK